MIYKLFGKIIIVFLLALVFLFKGDREVKAQCADSLLNSCYPGVSCPSGHPATAGTCILDGKPAVCCKSLSCFSEGHSCTKGTDCCSGQCGGAVCLRALSPTPVKDNPQCKSACSTKGATDCDAQNYQCTCLKFNYSLTCGGKSTNLFWSCSKEKCSVEPTKKPPVQRSPTPKPPGSGEPSNTPSAATPTPIPFSPTTVPSTVVPTSDPLLTDPYLVPIGNKPSLTVRIGGGPPLGDGPKVRFKAKLANTQGNPDMYFRLRVIDDMAFTNAGYTAPSCDNAGSGGKDFYIPVKADSNGIYTPVSSENQSYPAGALKPPISSDGWITLSGLTSGRYYSFILKGSKTRGDKLTEHVVLSADEASSQDFDWTDQPLEPGDLPDPNNSMKQDCTVNSVDISLIRTRINACCNPSICTGRVEDSTCPDWDKLTVGDVNYDGVINGNDVAKVVYTLSTKPDDDN